MRCFDPACRGFGATLDDAENSLFAGATSSPNLPRALVLVHVLGEAADEGFVRLNLAAHFNERSGLHGKADAVIHKPGGLLSNAKRPVHLVAADPVLAVGNHPNRGEPLAEINRAVLKDGSDLGRELFARVRLFALPKATGCDKPDIAATARWAADTIRPAKLYHRRQRNVGVREVADSIDEGLRFSGCVLHTHQYDTGNSLRQVYYYPKKALPARQRKYIKEASKRPLLRRQNLAVSARDARATSSARSLTFIDA